MRKLHILILGSGYACLFVYLVGSGSQESQALISAANTALYISLVCATIALLLTLFHLLRVGWQGGRGTTLCGLAVNLLLFAMIYAAPGVLGATQYESWAHARMYLRAVGLRINQYADSHGRLPQTLTELGSIDEFVDPYSPSGEPVSWMVEDSSRGYLISVGPDRVPNLVSDVDRTAYDPTNGILSAGDIIHCVTIP